jgi:hypothetical protein
VLPFILPVPEHASVTFCKVRLPFNALSEGDSYLTRAVKLSLSVTGSKLVTFCAASSRLKTSLLSFAFAASFSGLKIQSLFFASFEIFA